MNIEIVKAVNNKKYVSRKNEQEYWHCKYAKRIWLKEEVSLVADGSVIYKLCLQNGKAIEGKVFGKGYDENGFYMVFNMNDFQLDNPSASYNLLRIQKGAAELSEIFNPHEDEAFGELFDFNYKFTPFFDDASLNYKQTECSLELDFKGGSLGDTGITLDLSEIMEQYISDEETNLDWFMDGTIKEIYFRKESSGEYTIKIEGQYQDIIEEDIEKEVDGEMIKGLHIITITHANQAFFRCRKIFVKKYNSFETHLVQNGIQLIRMGQSEDLPSASALRKKWVDIFLKDVNTEGAYIDQFLWHAFSYNRIKGLEREAAQQALADEKKEVLYLFFNDEDDTRCYRLENAESFNHEMLRYYEDIYVVDEDFAWTYVFTHEEHCGPYFYSRTEC